MISQRGDLLLRCTLLHRREYEKISMSFPAGDGTSGRVDKYNLVQKGSKVVVDWNGSGYWYSGIVAEVNSNGSVNIDYDDGDSESNVSIDSIQISPFSENDPLLEPIVIGSAVLAIWKGDGSLYPAKITNENSDFTFDIIFDDGEISAGLSRSSMEIRLSNGWFQGLTADGKVQHILFFAI